MTRQVTLTSRAELQLYDAALWWAENRSTEQAVRWLEGFQEAIRKLAENADQWPLPPESDVLPFDARQLVFGLGRKKTHRAIFEIRGDKVFVHLIRHLAQDAITEDDL